jgi:hypothetical protein
VLPNHRQEDCLVAFQVADGCFVVSAHQGAVASDIGSEDSGQPALDLYISCDVHRN